MGRRLAQHRAVLAIEIEQRIALARDRMTEKRFDALTVGQAVVAIFDLQKGVGCAVRIERHEPSPDFLHPLEEFAFLHALRFAYGHAVGIAERPVETCLDDQPLRDSQHQPRRACGHCPHEGMEIWPWPLASRRKDAVRALSRSEYRYRFPLVELDWIKLHGNPIGRAVGQYLQEFLLGIMCLPD